MNVLFITLLEVYSINEHTIYTDLLREFIKHGNRVYMVSPSERKNREKTRIIKQNCCEILKPKIGNIQKTNIIEKGITSLTLENHIIKAIRKHWSNIEFDLILYTTPPITITNIVEFFKKRDGAKTYLLLKDIFPQNSVDLGMLSTIGLKALPYKWFRYKEKKLYSLSDKIGCMSDANIDYILSHNPEVYPDNVELCPNSIEVVDKSITDDQRVMLRIKYGIPLNKKVFVYGGNLGKPQSIPFIIDCLKNCQSIGEAFFLIVGDGTEYYKLAEYVKTNNPDNVKLIKKLPKVEYDSIIVVCDVGLVFLDFRFTIPNFPSRLLAYMQAGLPVIAATDRVTDIGSVIVDGGFGWSCPSNDVRAFKHLIKTISQKDNYYLNRFGQNGYQYLRKHYTSELCYNKISKMSCEYSEYDEN